jgi:CheY-like chemotaxis protein
MHILVVDDEPDIRTMLDVVLTAEGWAVEQAASGDGNHKDVGHVEFLTRSLVGASVTRRPSGISSGLILLIFAPY